MNWLVYTEWCRLVHNHNCLLILYFFVYFDTNSMDVDETYMWTRQIMLSVYPGKSWTLYRLHDTHILYPV